MSTVSMKVPAGVGEPIEEKYGDTQPITEILI